MNSLKLKPHCKWSWPTHIKLVAKELSLFLQNFLNPPLFFLYWSSLFACWFDLVFCGHRLYLYVYLQAMASSIYLIQLPDKYFQKTIFVMVLYSVTLPQHSSLTLMILLDFPSDLLFLFSYYAPPTCASPSPLPPGYFSRDGIISFSNALYFISSVSWLSLLFAQNSLHFRLYLSLLSFKAQVPGMSSWSLLGLLPASNDCSSLNSKNIFICTCLRLHVTFFLNSYSYSYFTSLLYYRQGMDCVCFFFLTRC